ncbi:MAG TPA: endolytic transglycosylase MltG [Candidatus Paceibacterota bacterium]|nr:endolytic transglycosylase MltG [Candidatus Paceibacterota bacterium]
MVLFSYLPFVLEALYLHIVRKGRFYAGLAFVLFVMLPAWILLIPASSFPHGALVEVNEDMTFSQTATQLENRDIVENAVLFKVLARVTGVDTSVKAGRYLFTEPQGVAVVLYRLATGDSGIRAVRITFPEGITVREMGEILGTSLPGFATDTFVTNATPLEGYLFPDTYAFYADVTPEEVITRMRARFDEVWSEIAVDTPEPKERIVIMASILEKETKVGEDRQVVSGILWKRIDIGMALQVDAVFGYIKGVDTYHPSGDDLEIDSPYNTYEYPDLPPGPIGNPGKDALQAALHPIASDYLYYLSDAEGVVHYAEDFEGHKKNKEQYLR